MDYLSGTPTTLGWNTQGAIDKYLLLSSTSFLITTGHKAAGEIGITWKGQTSAENLVRVSDVPRH